MLPLSAAQQRMWFLNELHEEDATYVVSSAFRIKGPFVSSDFASALADVTRRHDSLRTIYTDIDGLPAQTILDQPPVDLTIAQMTEERLESHLVTLSQQGFNLRREPPLRARILNIGPEDHVLFLAVHHIAVDEWSLGLLLRELADAYASWRIKGKPPEWKSTWQQSDFASWQIAHLGSIKDPASRISRGLEFWRTELQGLSVNMALPYDRSPHGTTVRTGHRISFDVPPDVHQRLADVAKSLSVTPFIMMTSVTSALLYRLGCGSEFAMATVMSGRAKEEFESIVGLLTNTLTVRADMSGNPTFTEVVGRVKKNLLASIPHSDVPFEHVVREAFPERDDLANPLKVMLAFQNSLDLNLSVPGADIEQLPSATESARFDLTFYLRELRDEEGRPAGVRCTVNYAKELFDAATVERIGQGFINISAQIAHSPAIRLRTLSLMAADEIEYVRDTSKGPVETLDRRTLVDLLELQAASTPDLYAVAASANEPITYAEMHGRANRLARQLIARGIGPEKLVALLLPHSPDMIVAMLAVLKSGAAYIPMDPRYPAARVNTILEDALPSMIITTSESIGTLAGHASSAVVLDEWELDARSDAARESEPLTNEHRTSALHQECAAYVIYTSGSTGRPKGVVVSHRSLVNYVLHIGKEYAGLTGDTVLHSSFAFDFTGTSLYGTLSCGGTVTVAFLDGDELAAAHRPAPSFLKVTPSHLGLLELLPAEQAPRHELLFGGEALMARPLDRWRERHPTVDVINHFGPTEATIGCMDFRLRAGAPLPDGPVPIGRPMSNVSTYVLDDDLTLLPDGFPGELYIAGECLARAYLNRPGLSSARFVADPLGAPGSRMYRTGDRVRRRSDGQMEYLGRVDDQIKIRGHRIEPAEIQAALLRLPDITEAVVVVADSAQGESRLLAYVTGSGPAAAAARAAVARDLPDYLVPSQVIHLDDIPVTVNGKLDRAALPQPETFSRQGPPQLAPGLVDRIRQACAETLGLREFGAEDNFFDRGGTSLTAVRLVRLLREWVRPDLPLRLVFKFSSPHELAVQLDPNGTSAQARELSRESGRTEQHSSTEPTPRMATEEFPLHSGSVLLTGATGFFGAYVLERLVEEHPGQIYCLVRADSTAHARERLLSNLRRLELPEKILDYRVVPVAGDLGLPHLGLEPAAFERLGTVVGSIYHVAAEVNSYLTTEQLHSSNVVGTRELLALARLSERAVFHLVSTMSVAHDGTLGGYAESKLLAEELVRAESAKGMYTTISRLPRLSGAVASGCYNPQDIMHHAIEAVLRIGAAPNIEVTEDWIPVDRAAEDFVRAVHGAEGPGQLIAFVPHQRVSLAECLDLARELGHELRTLPFDAWQQYVMSHPSLDGEIAAATLGAKRASAAAGGRDRNDIAAEEGFALHRVEGPGEAALRAWLRRIEQTSREEQRTAAAPDELEREA
ncbi:amino acid adenylation domain-containing protein [Streptomyces sp. NPDC020965]|uniref:amino acid adenylation domain-containing protein n=1 Tax=Streptomyces sp. NPDC020965 TaxID=3365105 RepID=UPI003793B633